MRTKISNEEKFMNIRQLPLCKYWVCTLKLLYFQSLSLCSILQAWKPLIPALNKRFPLLMYLCLCKQILINGCYSERCTSNWSEFCPWKTKQQQQQPCLQFTDTLFASSQGWNRAHRVIKQSVCFKYMNIQLYIEETWSKRG